MAQPMRMEQPQPQGNNGNENEAVTNGGRMNFL